ncbi:MAG: hypothetical protein WAL98_11890 [Desulfatiglandaceae bacterium]
MKIRVKLFGTLHQDVPGYDHNRGLVVEIPDESRIADLLDHVEISPSENVSVAVNSCIRKTYEVLREGELVNIFVVLASG